MSETEIEGWSKAELWERFNKSWKAESSGEPGKVEAALAAVDLLYGEEAAFSEFRFIVARVETIASQTNLAVSLRNGIKARGVDPRPLLPSDDARYQAYTRAVEEEAYTILEKLRGPGAPVLERVYPINDVDFARKLAEAVVPQGGTSSPEAETAFSTRLKAARTIIDYRKSLAGRTAVEGLEIDQLSPAYERIKTEGAANKAAQEDAASRAKLTRLLALVGAVPLGLVLVLMLVSFLAMSGAGEVEHWQLFPVIFLAAGGFAWCMRRVVPSLVKPTLWITLGVVALNVGLGAGSHLVVGQRGVSAENDGSGVLLIIGAVAATIAAWCYAPVGSPAPAARRRLLIGNSRHAIPLLGVALLLPSATLLRASWTMQMPGLLPWLLLLGLAAALAIIGHREKAAIGAALGVPVIVAAVTLIRAAGGPMLVYPLGLAALFVLLAATDDMLALAVRLIAENMTKHRDLARGFDDRISLDPALRGRLSVMLTGFPLLFWGSLMVALFYLPQEGASAADIAYGPPMLKGAFLAFVALFIGLVLFKRFAFHIKLVVKRRVELEGPLRKEKIYRNGQEMWVQRGMSRGPDVVLADAPGVDTEEAARPGYERVWDDATGKFVWRQTIVGNPHIKAEAEPLKPAGEMGTGAVMSEEEAVRRGLL